VSKGKKLKNRDYGTRKGYVDLILEVVQNTEFPTPDLVRRIYQIFAQAEISPEDRVCFLEALYFKNRKSTNASLDRVPDKEVAFSLLKDTFTIGHFTNSDGAEDLARKITQKFGIDEQQIRFLRSWTDWENNILEKMGKTNGTVSEEDMPVELEKKATSVGVPIAALTLSGSVIGLSASGITSGLAAIGTFSGLTALSLNPMTAGIAALIGGGIAVKKILDTIFPSTQRENNTAIQRAQMENELKQLKELRRKYTKLLECDAKLFEGGSWWELFLPTRRQKRKMAVQQLHDLASSEKGA